MGVDSEKRCFKRRELLNSMRMAKPSCEIRTSHESLLEVTRWLPARVAG